MAGEGKCCCCNCTYITGAKVIAWLSIVIWVLIIAGSAIGLADDYLADEYFTSYVVQLVLGCIALPVNVLLLVGIKRIDPRFMLAWLGYYSASIVVGVAVNIYVVVVTGDLVFLLNFLSIAISLLFMTIVFKAYKEVKEARLTHSTKNIVSS